MIFSDAVVLDLYTLVVGALALFILGVLLGLVGSPWWERRVQRRLQMQQLQNTTREPSPSEVRFIAKAVKEAERRGQLERGMKSRPGSGYVGVLVFLIVILALYAWFTHDRNECRKKFAASRSPYDSLLIADAYNCEFAATNDLSRIGGRMQERCRSRGGYWLDKPIQVGESLTRCIVGPQPVSLIDSERVP